ncbi:uncharacterized protein EAF02_000170 [Botrytis sinoallii]|uniref:uncharacterized protein n=1 Tax=Botrytis sinoallii TaxID=1463999 RepID=UPI0019025E3F|nr:uncharacterized protein EAF02_000170 [Botrytis sinoallii]KAF7892632.1 hypothetical protein EAF02_000170 [Botrytis sinoallii]
MSPFTVTEAHTRPEIHTIALLIQKANRTPYRPFVAIQTPSAPDLPTALSLSQDWFWNNHTHTPRSHWITVQDSETGEVVGAANCVDFHFFEKKKSSKVSFFEDKTNDTRCWSEAEGGIGREGARFLLEKHGWRPLLKYCIYGTKENMSEEWQELCHKCLPQEQYAMWKPKGGVWTDDSILPWDLGAEN